MQTDEPMPLTDTGIKPGCYLKPSKMTQYIGAYSQILTIACSCKFTENDGGWRLCTMPVEEYKPKPSQLYLLTACQNEVM